jgi:hypothetical protein
MQISTPAVGNASSIASSKVDGNVTLVLHTIGRHEHPEELVRDEG